MPICHVNADDFGLHPDIDRGILACVERGRVAGVSVSANGPNIDWSAVRALAAGPTQLGVRVTLVGERWLTQPRVFKSWTSLVPWLLVPGRRAALEAEVRAQIGAFVAADVRPAHLDSHQHVHVMSPIWGVCVKLASEFGIGRIRVPNAPDHRVAKPSMAGRVLQRLSEHRRRSEPMQAGPPCIGIAHAGRNSAAVLVRELEAAEGRDVELVAHPGVGTDALKATYGAWRLDWDAEREALLADYFARACDRLGYRIAPLSPRSHRP